MLRRVVLRLQDVTLVSQVKDLLRRHDPIQLEDPRGLPPGVASVWIVDEEADDLQGDALGPVVRRQPAVFLQTSRDARRTTRALRQGYRECLLMPEDLPLLPGAIERCISIAAVGGQHADALPTGRVIAVFSATGGSGRTTVSAHLAAALAVGGLRTAAIDLSLRLGALRQLYGVPGTSSLADLLPVLDELNDRNLHNALHRLGPHLDLLPAPGPGVLPDLTDSEVRQLLEAFQTRYQAVVLDLPPVLDGVASVALAAASAVVYLLEPTATGLWALGALLGRYDAATLPRDRLQVVLNHRSPHAVTLASAEVQKMYGVPVVAEIGFDPSAHVTPVLRTWEDPARLSGLARDVGRLAERVAGQRLVAGAPAPGAVGQTLWGLVGRLRSRPRV